MHLSVFNEWFPLLTTITKNNHLQCRITGMLENISEKACSRAAEEPKKDMWLR